MSPVYVKNSHESIIQHLPFFKISNGYKNGKEENTDRSK